MKNLTVLIRAELEVPDDWQLVEHPSGIQVLKVGDQFVDFDLAPLTTRSDDAEAEWSDADSDLVEEVLNAVVGLEADLEIGQRH
jgi:hypothetical protein